ncbi:hypothetical protein E3J95_00735 [Candidatus Aerophobetes bacterium]|uniref:Uncharacterized protein n=1 Tax=Aerophobetes bacterium TaxID=2030807 RepID=A0A523QM95_UNCAE|nr:MAG: hypothetical protein E3J95_00735 [Candidatus Aerophobetes bacterium]
MSGEIPDGIQCDVDDILCQFEVLQNLRGLQKNLGNETFLEKFPEFEGMDRRIADEIKAYRGSLREALEKCSGLGEEIIEEAAKLESEEE